MLEQRWHTLIIIRGYLVSGRCVLKWQMLWTNHSQMGNLIWYGPWRVGSTCLTNPRLFFLLCSWLLLWSSCLFVCMPYLFQPLQFVSELVRVAAPGATIIIVTWCHRDLGPSEDSLQPWEHKLLQKICDGFYLPAWCSTADYVKLLESHGLQVSYSSYFEHHHIYSFVILHWLEKETKHSL